MSKKLFPQPRPLQDRYYKIYREYAERNPLLYGYSRHDKEENYNDYNEFLKYYRRKFPFVRIDTLQELAKESFDKYRRHQEMYYFNPESLYLFERPYNNK